LDNCVTAVEVKTEGDPAEVSERLQVLGRERFADRSKALYLKLEDEATPFIRAAEQAGWIREGADLSGIAKSLRSVLSEGEIPKAYEEELRLFLNTYDKLTMPGVEGWIVEDETADIDYTAMRIDCDNITKLKRTFSLLFILVGALVIYATIGKMIDEQREQIGGMKAFGMRKREIFTKYLLYGVSSTAIGMLLGILAARFVFEGIVLHSYSRYYNYDIEKPLVAPGPVGIVLVVGIGLAVTAAYLACGKLLRLPADRLLRPRVPQVKKTHSHRKQTIYSLYGRLILRNMRSDKKRIAVTIAAVAGSCALIVTGFTLRFAVDESVDRQYSQIVGFDEKIRYNTSEGGRKIEELLDKEQAVYMNLEESYVRYPMENAAFGRLWCGEIEKLTDFFQVSDWKTGEKLSLREDGVYIQRRIAEIYDLRVGDLMPLQTEKLQSGNVRIAGIFENYIGSYVFMDRETYGKVFCSAPEPNIFLVNYADTDGADVLSSLQKIDGFETAEAADVERSMFESVTSVVNGVILLLIFLAAMMTAVVLSNLANMYMLQKKRELTILRVNGFTVAETIGYMIRDTIVTTVIGIVLGCVAGSAAGYHILRSLEQPYTRMVRSVSIAAWGIGAGITLVFTTLVYMVVLRKVKHLKLSDLTEV